MQKDIPQLQGLNNAIEKKAVLLVKVYPPIDWWSFLLLKKFQSVDYKETQPHISMSSFVLFPYPSSYKDYP